MAPLTWRNVEAPNFQGAASAIGTAGQLMTAAGSGFINAIDSYQEGRTQSESAKLMASIMGAKDAAGIQALVSGQGGVDPRYLSPDALTFAMKREDMLMDNALGSARLAQAGRGKGGGGGGSGGGRGRGKKAGGDDIVDNSTGGTGYISSNGVVTDVPTASALAQIPTTVPVAPQAKAAVPVAAPVVAQAPAVYDAPEMPASTDNFAPMVPVTEVAPAPVAVTTAAPAGNAVTVTPAQVAESVPTTISQSVAPSVGPLRGANRPKGKDGGQQIFPELTSDLSRIRMAAINGNLDAANVAVTANPRLARNLSATNALDMLDNNVKAVKPAVEAREALRAEAESGRSRARSEAAYATTADFLPTTTSKEDALARVTSLDPKERAAQIADIEAADKQGYWNVPDISRLASDGSTILPTYLNDRGSSDGGGAVPTSAVINQPAPVVEGQAPAVVDPASAANELKQAVVPYTGRNLDEKRVQSQRILDQINLDSSANPVRPLLSDYEATMNSKEGPAAVAAKLVSSGDKGTSAGIFSGMEARDVAGVINRYATQYKVTPAMAAKAIENSIAPSSLAESVTGIWNSAPDNVIDKDKLNQLLSTFATEDGKPSPRILQEIEKERRSTLAATDVRDRMADLDRATAELTRAQNLKAAGRPVDLKAAETTAKVAESNFDKAYNQLIKTDSPAFQNRGPYPSEAPAKGNTPAATPQAAPVKAAAPVAPAPVSPKAQRAQLYQSIIADMKTQLGREPTWSEFQEIQKKATDEVMKRMQ